MAVLVWAMTGIALWHFAVFMPDRFWGGIVGAFGAAILGSVVLGFAIHVAVGGSLGDTGIETILVAALGAAAALGGSWAFGARRGEQPIQH